MAGGGGPLGASRGHQSQDRRRRTWRRGSPFSRQGSDGRWRSTVRGSGTHPRSALHIASTFTFEVPSRVVEIIGAQLGPNRRAPRGLVGWRGREAASKRAKRLVTLTHHCTTPAKTLSRESEAAAAAKLLSDGPHQLPWIIEGGRQTDRPTDRAAAPEANLILTNVCAGVMSHRGERKDDDRKEGSKEGRKEGKGKSESHLCFWHRPSA